MAIRRDPLDRDRWDRWLCDDDNRRQEMVMRTTGKPFHIVLRETRYDAVRA